jgi:PAS domain S-box-containing protein
MARKMSLAQFVAASLVGVTTLLLVAMGILAYRTDAEERREDLYYLQKLQVDELAVALADPVWNIDRPQIAKILEAMTQPVSVYGVVVTAAGETFGRVKKDPDSDSKVSAPWDGRSPRPGLWFMQEPIRYSNKPIGSIRLYVTPKGLKKDSRRTLLQLVGGGVLIDLLIVVSVYFLMWRAVLRPLTEIEHYAGAVSAGDERRMAPREAGSIELESLRTSIQSMVAQLEFREQRFRSIFESANDAIFILDHETGAILDVNARMCEMFGYTREEVASLDLGALSSGAPPFTQDDALARVRALKPGGRRIFEWHCRHRDGHLFWVEVSMRTAVIGGAMRVVAVVRDVEERRQMAEALRRGETMSMMGSLVAGVAHEVRNPLFGIAATLDAFEAELGKSEVTAEYLSTLRNDVSRLSRLMHDLLDYGRPHPMERHIQPIVPVIDEAIRVCTPRAKEKRIEIRQDVADPLPEVSIDADRILLVLKNVVENAVEFSSSGQSVMLHVRSEDSSLVCAVEDRGPGFRPEDLPHVFEPFFTRRPGGSGLGLAIVQKIVGDHGGSITASNAAGGGGVVEIRLPAAE